MGNVGQRTAVFHARVRGLHPGLGGLKENVSSPSIHKTCTKMTYIKPDSFHLDNGLSIRRWPNSCTYRVSWAMCCENPRVRIPTKQVSITLCCLNVDLVGQH